MNTDSAAHPLDKTVQMLDKGRLLTPALAFLTANYPLSFVGSQLLLLFQPVLDPFIDRQRTGLWAEILADPDHVDDLIARLKQIQDTRKSQ
jgi:hypothetical protein